jgi:DNA-binding response OmpR family regulator
MSTNWSVGQGWADDPGDEGLEIRSLRILLAEDDPEMRRILAMVLRRDGYEVVEARDGLELLRSIASPGLVQGRAANFDLIVSDLRMPLFSGLDGLTYLNECVQRTPVILITAFGDGDTHREALRLGARRVFNKPFDVSELSAYVGEVLAS